MERGGRLRLHAGAMLGQDVTTQITAEVVLGMARGRHQVGTAGWGRPSQDCTEDPV